MAEGLQKRKLASQEDKRIPQEGINKNQKEKQKVEINERDFPEVIELEEVYTNKSNRKTKGLFFYSAQKLYVKRLEDGEPKSAEEKKDRDDKKNPYVLEKRSWKWVTALSVSYGYGTRPTIMMEVRNGTVLVIHPGLAKIERLVQIMKNNLGESHFQQLLSDGIPDVFLSPSVFRYYRRELRVILWWVTKLLELITLIVVVVEFFVRLKDRTFWDPNAAADVQVVTSQVTNAYELVVQWLNWLLQLLPLKQVFIPLILFVVWQLFKSVIWIFWVVLFVVQGRTAIIFAVLLFSNISSLIGLVTSFRGTINRLRTLVKTMLRK